VFGGNRKLFILGRRFFVLPRLAMWWLARQVRRDPEAILSLLLRSPSVAEADKEILGRPEVRRTMGQDILEAFRQGSRGAAWEGVLVLARPWDFRLEEIKMEVHLWHGEADANVPVAAGRYVARTIPNCRVTFLPGEGHYMVVDRMAEIMTAMGLAA
jgi:pimeloyl-ACP methyl ester carboxylesterase